MDIKVLKNVLEIAQKGSMTDAADESHLTLQALAAQLNKLEEHLGLKLFQRTNKGMLITSQGRDILPYIAEVVRASAQLKAKAEQLAVPCKPRLCISLNSTLCMEANEKIMLFLLNRLSAYDLVFHSSESPDNLLKLEAGDVDIAVVLNSNLPNNLHTFKLPGLQIKVVAAYLSKHVEISNVIKPLPQCPYSSSYSKLLNAFAGSENFPTYQSGSELISVSMIKNLKGIGLVSAEMALANNFATLPGFEDVLDVHLIMKHPILALEDMALPQNNLLYFPEIQRRAHPIH